MSDLYHLRKPALVELAEHVLVCKKNGYYGYLKHADRFTVQQLRRMFIMQYPESRQIKKIKALRDGKFVKYSEHNLTKNLTNLARMNAEEEEENERIKSNMDNVLTSLKAWFDENKSIKTEVDEVIKTLDNNTFEEITFRIPNDVKKLVYFLLKVSPAYRLTIELDNAGTPIFTYLNDYSLNTLRELLKEKTTINFNLNTLFEATDELEAINTSDSANLNNPGALKLDNISSIRFFKHFNKSANKFRTYKNVGGAFFKYSLTKYPQLKSVLARYQIFDVKNNKKEFKQSLRHNCLVYALKMSGQFSDAEIDSINTMMTGRMVAKKKLKELADKWNIEFTTYISNQNRYETTKPKYIASGETLLTKRSINLYLIEEHYFLDECIDGITKYYINNIDDIEEKCQNMSQEIRFKLNKKRNGKHIIDKSHKSGLTSGYLVKTLLAKGAFEPLTLAETMSTDTYKYVPKTIDVNKLEISDTEYTKIVSTESKKKSGNKDDKEGEVYRDSDRQSLAVYYADCEADTSTKTHTAYSIAYVKRGTKNIEFIFGKDCIAQFIDRIEDKSTVYFHNLGYDSRLFLAQGINVARNIITKGSKVMSITMKKGSKMVYLKDSYSLLSMPLTAFPSSFGLKNIKKEMFPYNYYTFENFERLNLKGVI